MTDTMYLADDGSEVRRFLIEKEGLNGVVTLSGEQRRFWHDDDKLEIVMSVGVDGASVTQVA